MHLLLTALLGLAWGADLASARAETERYPGDYGAWADLARAAEAAGRPAEAQRAWARAGALSDGALEATLGVARSALAADDRAAAREAAAAATAAAPALPYAWRLRAEALRRPVGAEAPSRAAARAHGAAVTALALDPADPWSRCERAWSDLRRGRSHAARAAFDRIDHPCAGAGRAAAAPQTTGWAALWGGLQAYPSGASATDAALGTLAGGATLRGRARLDAVGRLGRIGLVDDGAGPTAPWRELWGAAALVGHAVTPELVVGGSTTTWPAPPTPAGPPLGATETTRALIVGGALSAGLWPAWTASGAHTWADGGPSWQAGLDATLDATAGLRLGAGLQASAWTWAAADQGPLQSDRGVDAAATGAPLWSGRLSAVARGDRLRVGGTVRVGAELRPVRLEDRFSWALPRRLGPSADLTVAARVAPAWWLHARCDAASLPADGAAFPTAAALLAGSLGLSYTPAGASR